MNLQSVRGLAACPLVDHTRTSGIAKAAEERWPPGPPRLPPGRADAERPPACQAQPAQKKQLLADWTVTQLGRRRDRRPKKVRAWAAEQGWS